VQAPNTPIFAWRLWLAAPPEVVLEPISLTDSQALERRQIPIHPGVNAVEGYKASKDGDGLRARGLPQIIQRGAAALTPAEKELRCGCPF